MVSTTRGASTPRAGYVSCTSIVAGALTHNCAGTDAPHRLLVCVLKDHTLPAVDADLEHRADARAIEHITIGRPERKNQSGAGLYTH